MSRDDIVRLGQAGRPWEFLPVVLQALRVAPADTGLRVLAAANFGAIGLRTAGLDQLGATASADAATVNLRRRLEALPEDRIAPESLEAACRANVEAIGDDPVRRRLLGVIEGWAAGTSEWDWFRAAGGNVVRRRRGEWLGLADHAGAANGFAAQHLKLTPEKTPPLFTVEGVDPPWVLMEVARATPRHKDGFQPRLVVVQADESEFLDGLAHADLRGALGDDRTTLFVGADAGERFGAWLAARSEWQIAGPSIPLHSVRRRVQPAADQSLQRARAGQLEEHNRLAAEVRSIYAGRDRAWWNRRFASPGAEPIRVLVPTCRYSTFIKHSSEDLVGAMRDAGCEAELLIEPDDHTKLSSVAYLGAVARLKPDLVVLINYPRASLGLPLPRELPFVCWVQDAMPQQFDAKVGAGQGPFDFLVGHLHPEMFTRFGFDRARAMEFPVVASTTKFHAGPVDAALRRRFECEIGFISHHSETPEAMHARLTTEAGPDPFARRVLDRLRPEVESIALDPMASPPQPTRLAAAVERIVRDEGQGREPPARMLALFTRQYAIPMAERYLRHQTLGWAADLAECRGWRLRIFGRGWERHERFARFAGGEVAHGEELRAAYQSAAVQVHVSVMALVHQRVMECALSGGLPVCRLTESALATVRTAARRRAVAESPPVACELATRRLGIRVADSPDLVALSAQLRTLGLEAVDGICWYRPAPDGKSAPVPPEESRIDWLLGGTDAGTFVTPQQLERITERAANDPEGRTAASAGVAARVRERLSHAAFVPRLQALLASF